MLSSGCRLGCSTDLVPTYHSLAPQPAPTPSVDRTAVRDEYGSTHWTASTVSSPSALHSPTMPDCRYPLGHSLVQCLHMEFWVLLHATIWYCPAEQAVHFWQYLGPSWSVHGNAS